MESLEKFMYKLFNVFLQLYSIITFLLIGVDLAFIIFYQFIKYDPQVVIVACVTLFIAVYTNKALGGK